MPETARILNFPSRVSAPRSAEDVSREARLYLEGVLAGTSDDRRQELLAEPDVLLSFCALLRGVIDSKASAVFGESVALYRLLSLSDERVGGFDEKDYFRGETALLAATASRVLGKRSETEIWLDRAEAGFRHTVNPSPLLAHVSYQRLALRCETGRYSEVAELAPLLAQSFSKLDMPRDHAKCILLEGLALKQSGNHEAALRSFEYVSQVSLQDSGLVGMAFVNLADIHAAEGRDDSAADCYLKAVPLLEKANRPAAVAHLKSAIAETLRRQGRMTAAIDAYRGAISDYESLGMSTWVAYLRVVTAQTLLEAGKPREAEWQVLAALPTIDEQRMVPEGFAAVSLLRESVRQRKTDPAALLELRQYLQAKN